jgi:putative NADH-flavin reductase
MKQGNKTGEYRLGFNAFSGMSKISFADCAHAMLRMLSDDTWVGKAPIIQY